MKIETFKVIIWIAVIIIVNAAVGRYYHKNEDYPKCEDHGYVSYKHVIIDSKRKTLFIQCKVN